MLSRMDRVKAMAVNASGMSPRHQQAQQQQQGDGKLDVESLADSQQKDLTPHHPHSHVFGVPAVLVSGIAYALSSGCLTLLNKYALAGFNFSAPNALLFFQCALTVVLVKGCELFGLVKPLQPLKSDLMAVWCVVARAPAAAQLPDRGAGGSALIWDKLQGQLCTRVMRVRACVGSRSTCSS